MSARIIEPVLKISVKTLAKDQETHVHRKQLVKLLVMFPFVSVPLDLLEIRTASATNVGFLIAFDSPDQITSNY